MGQLGATWELEGCAQVLPAKRLELGAELQGRWRSCLGHPIPPQKPPHPQGAVSTQAGLLWRHVGGEAAL